MRPRPVVLAVAALVLGLPSGMLVARWVAEGSRPVSEYPASFQVYSAAPAPTYTGTDGAGVVRRLDVDRLPVVLRAVGTGRLVPDLLCDRNPDLLVVQRTGGPQPGTFRC